MELGLKVVDGMSKTLVHGHTHVRDTHTHVFI